ncbi:hypothetical protein [Thalassomonas actiniarum]|uniref:Uncharacterized protein n=1 Tax=Thalassomonas actiniarum TaxID=485447 RepID=A0AAF0C2W4_9GAMM|nr:hypothetical protein [Thalassomonas actiniarum]WDD98079.1 hypothetical protein SG35_022775 [Thalassomonas actiniarum]
MMARKQPRSEFQRDVDDVLTESINNNRGAREFILRNTARMAKEIEDRFGPELVQVYIKGKSSLKLMKLNTMKADSNEEKAEELGWSDFDNQIIINPYLPRTWWYEIFNQIHCYLRDEYLPSVRDTFMVKAEPQTPDDYQAPHMAQVPFGQKLRRQIDLYGPETELKHAQKMQSHVLLCLGNEYLHPLNFFDNTRTVFGKRPDKDIDFMSEDFTEANNFFPPSVTVLKGEDGKKVKSDSSIWINCTISKFLLYRLIVRYSSPGVNFNGEKCRDDINGETGKFRGEVIDISIPRRESEETINYWSRFKGDLHQLTDTNTYLRDLVAKKKLPELAKMRALRVPGWEYQLQENVIMLHEVLTYTSGSAHKFYKRLERAWPALTAIEQSSEKQKLSKLNSALFKHIPELQQHYQFYNQDAIKSFYKQFAAILREDYHWDVLDKEARQELVVKYLPAIEQLVQKHSDTIEDLLNKFNVEKDGEDEKKSANYILKDAFSVKESDRFDSQQEKEEAIAAANQAIENYKELLRHLFIVHESNKAFGRKFHLDIAQIYRINTFRMGLEECCNTGKRPKEIELLLGEEHEPYLYTGEDSSYDMDSKELGPSIELQPMSKAPKKESSSSLTSQEENQVGFGLKGKLSLQDVLDSTLDIEKEYIPQSPKQVLTTVDEHEAPPASCYFCGILSSSLDLAMRMKLFNVQELGLDYFFPVVNLYLKCTKGQWAKLKEAYLIDKQENPDPNQFIWQQKSLAPHKIRVIFIDSENQGLAVQHDTAIVEFDKELTTQRVNDRLGINTLSQQADHLYNCIAGMNARLIEVYKRYKNEEERDKAAVEVYQSDPLRATEIQAREKHLKTLADKMQDIDTYLLKPLKDIYGQLCPLKKLVNKAEKKGHIRDLLERHKELSIPAENIVKLIEQGIVKGTDAGKNIVAKRYGEFGITDEHVNELILAANELRGQTEALKINPRKDQALVMKALQKSADNLENNQESLIFARGNNDRGVLIEGRPFRILREPQINQYFHYYIGKTRDFYLLHWLDHKRVHYKSNITNFRTQLSRWIEMPDPSKRNGS